MYQKFLLLLIVAAGFLLDESYAGGNKGPSFLQPVEDAVNSLEEVPTQILCVDGDTSAYFAQPQTFENANRICQKFKSNTGVLSVPRRNRDLEAFSTISAVSKLTEMWVGMSLDPNTLVSNPADFLPVDEDDLGSDGLDFFQNARVGEFPWSAGEPDGTPKNPQQCVSYNRETNSLSDDSCEELKPFLCTSRNTCEGFPATCFGADLYSLLKLGNGSTFDESLGLCQGALVNIRSEQELDSVNNALKFSGLDLVDGVWVGINASIGSSGDPSKFVFADGTTDGLDFIHTEPGVFPWAPNEPDGGNIDAPEDCVVIDPVSGLLMDVSCDEQRFAFCKISHDEFCQQIDESLAPTLSPAGRTTEPVIALLILFSGFVASCF